MASKVLTLPTDNPLEACELLRKTLTENKILFIVLGDTGLAKETVRRADILTGGILEEPHWVIHAPNRTDIQEVLSTLMDPHGLVPDWDKPLAVVTSMTLNIRDMILRDGTQPIFTRIDDAFLAAELD